MGEVAEWSNIEPLKTWENTQAIYDHMVYTGQYIEDGFNLYGLRACVSNFSDCLDLILDRIGPDDSDDSHLTQSACTLYGLIHARYIITAHGLDAMYNKV